MYYLQIEWSNWGQNYIISNWRLFNEEVIISKNNFVLHKYVSSYKTVDNWHSEFIT